MMRMNVIPRRRRWLGVCAAALAGAAGSSASARQETRIEPEPAAPAQAPAGEAPPAEVRLGMRVEALRQQIPLRETVVVVDSGHAYAAAIERWSLQERFPVLIDDGSDAARENIARFVRAFGAGQVIRWRAPESPAASGEPTAGDGAESPRPAREERDGADRRERRRVRRGAEEGEDGAARASVHVNRQRVEAAAAGAWEQTSRDALEAFWKEKGFQPPGVVVVSARDPAWTAGLALAAAHGQPLVWVDTGPGSTAGVMNDGALAALDGAVLAGVRALGRSWEQLGDEIDAITLCLNVPSRIQSAGGKEREYLALTDRIGRVVNAADPGAGGNRFAWCAMVCGDEQEAAYRAMCALFLRPGDTGAWLFDGYPRAAAGPYEIGRAVELLRQTEMPVRANMPPNGGLKDWREATRGGVRESFIHVNSKGMPEWFDLEPGRARTGDVPVLHAPALVHFIHSFSAARGDDQAGIAGRWMANGAYAYVGSVHEPFLSAFFPVELLAARMMAGAPLAAAARVEGGGGPATRVWKINIFGDPLITMARPVARAEGTLDVSAWGGVVVDLESEMKRLLGEKMIGAAAATLVMLGRDEDAVKLARAATKAESKTIDPALARAAVWAAFRMQDAALLTMLWGALPPEARGDARHVDMLWQGLRKGMEGGGEEEGFSEQGLTLLRMHVREDSAADDAALIAPHIKRLYGLEQVRSMFAALMSRTKNEEMKKELAKAMERY